MYPHLTAAETKSAFTASPKIDSEAAFVSTRDEMARHRELLRKALPDPADIRLFDRLMAEARALGLTWIDGLEYVIDKRRTVLH